MNVGNGRWLGRLPPFPVASVVVAVVAAFVVVLSWAVPKALAGRDSSTESAAAWLVVVAAPVGAGWLWRRWTHLERADETQRQVQRRLSAVVETGDELLWEMTAEGVITYIAPISRDYLGYAPEELTGRRVGVVLPAHERDRAAQLLSNSAVQACGWMGEPYTFLTKDGRERDFISSGIAHVGRGGQVVGFTGTVRRLEGSVSDRRRLEEIRDRVTDVLERRALRTVFQPIINLTTGSVIGAEALSRFPDEPVLAPDRWFADAAEVGLGVELELLAVASALDAARQLPPRIYVPFNLSPAALRSRQLIGLLRTSAWQPQPTRLVVEITEHVSVEDYEPLAVCIDELRRLGVRLAVDDAGAGYASFRHILRLTPDYIKLDRELVDGMDADPARRALVSAVVTFARDVGAAVIAEGIETAGELRTARLLRVEAAQGYFIARPSPAGAEWGTGGAHVQP
jgi:PAS domain S-box-containing protein